ncbi:MAG: GHMP kinase [Elusimicrobia bacterium]|nr:MAG: GHMP kinase [Elusimicrobiota bacterium]
MIISRTPFRISFAGGGTDLESFYGEEPGAVVSTAIDKYMYVSVHPYFEDRILLKYSRTELVKRVSQIKHPLMRESIRLAKIHGGIEIASAADVAAGTGLGSSSSFTVGLLHALHAFEGRYVSAERLAGEACAIEIDRVKEPIGKQDQTIAAHGGFQFIEFLPGGDVRVRPIIFPRGKEAALNERMLLFYTGATRSASRILNRQRRRAKANREHLRRIRGFADVARESLHRGRIDDLGEILHEGWELKKSLAKGISNPRIDRAYAKSRRAGALGGKVLGAGGGGFLLLFAKDGRQDAVRRSMKGWREIPFKFEPEGSKIVYVSG